MIDPVPPRDCATCKHVRGGHIDNGVMITEQKCKKHRVGRNSMFTWVVVRRENLCGPTRKNWEPKP